MHGMIDSPFNGATEIPGTEHDSLFVFLGGPIRYWWTPGVEGTQLHKYYLNARETIHQELSNDFLVYAPHRAWRGPWNNLAQMVNDLAVVSCHAFVRLVVTDSTEQPYEPLVPAVGTDAERALAQQRGVLTLDMPVGLNINLYQHVTKLHDELVKWDEYRKKH